MVKKVIVSTYTSKTIRYNFFMGDIYDALRAGLKTMGEWAKIQRQSSDIDIQCEYLNVAIGEVENAFFTLELFKDRQVLEQAFIPPTDKQIITRDIPEFRAKGENEVRLIICDFAFAARKSNDTDENDNTVLMCMSASPYKGEYDRSLEYMEVHGGEESDISIQRIRELYWDYNADYIVMDLRSGGESIYTALTRPFEHPTRRDWDRRGFTVVKDSHFQTINSTKLDELSRRAVDVNAIQCIIPVLATDDSNDRMWRGLLTSLSQGKIKLLIDSLQKEMKDESAGFLLMTNEERTQQRLPFVQTELLINEAVNLKQNTLKFGRIQLKEPRLGHKDRVVCLAYGNDFIDKLEHLLQYQDERFEEFDDSDWEGIFCV